MRWRTFIAPLGGAAAWLVILGPMLLAGSIWPSTVEAHDIYTTLQDTNGASCCSEHDCRPAQYRTTSAGVEMLVGGQWILIPNSKIQYRTLEGDDGKTNGGHWCGVRLEHDIFVTFCAVLPPRSSDLR